MKRATEKALKKMAGAGFPDVRAALDEISDLRERVAFMTGDAQDMRAEVERLRGLLREASGPMSHGRWSTDFRREVKDALGDSDDSEGRGQIATPPLPVSISYKLLEAENERLRGLVAKYEEYLGEEAERAARVVRALGDE
jgi:hypothetical protein